MFILVYSNPLGSAFMCTFKCKKMTYPLDLATELNCTGAKKADADPKKRATSAADLAIVEKIGRNHGRSYFEI